MNNCEGCQYLRKVELFYTAYYCVLNNEVQISVDKLPLKIPKWCTLKSKE